ncbi:hypothetical protein MNB_SV-13-1769 [hydrothermal vent metagenome]|uniref:RDD domain-containing protein n=1 Tax=hydrothermal vent metagenome TaxID=652676 RepID=A0A1W1CIW2_9ZZZZ
MKRTHIYAGFWVRSMASLIDIIVLLLPFILMVMLFDIWHILHLESIFIFLILWGVYSVTMLSSSWNATLGKKILGLKVLTKTLEPLHLKASLKRFIFAFITYILLLLPLLLSIRIFSFMSYSWTDIFLLPIFLPLLMMFFNKRKQVLHDYFAKTVVIDTKDRKTTKTYVLQGLGIFSVTAIIVSAFLFFNFIILGYGGYALQKELQAKYSFTKKYTIDDLGDKRIIFYNKALIKYSKDFVLAEGMYEIFEIDVKRDLALNCIEASLAQHNQKDWLEKGIKFRKNARNIPLKTQALIQKYKAQEKYLSDRFYQYNFNDVHDIIRSLADPFRKERNQNTCDKQLSVERMYTRFIRTYIGKQEQSLRYNKKSLAKNIPKDKAYYTKAIREGQEWLNLLYQNTKQMKALIEKDLLANANKESLAKIKETSKWERAKQIHKHKLSHLKILLFKKNKNIEEINKWLKQVIYLDLDKIGGTDGRLLIHETLKYKDTKALQILLDYGISPLEDDKILSYIFSDEIELNIFESIIRRALKPSNHMLISRIMFHSLSHHSSEKKIEFILEYLLNANMSDALYIPLVEDALEYCASTKTVSLLLGGNKFNKHNELQVLLQKPSYKCKNKKEIKNLLNKGTIK